MRRRRFADQQSVSQLPRVVDPPEEVFNRYFVDRGAPVVLVGSRMFGDRPLTLDDIIQRCADGIEVKVRTGYYLDPARRELHKMQLGDYLEKHVLPPTRGGTEPAPDCLPPYTVNTSISMNDFRKLGLSDPFLFDGKTFESPRLWLGPKGSLTRLHYDSRDNLMYQLVGSKRFLLYPPSQIRWLYTYGYAPTWSHVHDPRQPDLDAFPLFARASPIELTLKAGEILYLPARWSHFVQNADVSVMFNFWTERTPMERMKFAAFNFGQRIFGASGA